MNGFDHRILLGFDSPFRPEFSCLSRCWLKSTKKNPMIKFIHSNPHFKNTENSRFHPRLSPHLRAYNRPISRPAPKLGAFLAHGRQYSEMGLVYFVTSSQCFIQARNKHEQREIAFSFHRMPHSCIVFGCNNNSDFLITQMLNLT